MKSFKVFKIGKEQNLKKNPFLSKLHSVKVVIVKSNATHPSLSLHAASLLHDVIGLQQINDVQSEAHKLTSSNTFNSTDVCSKFLFRRSTDSNSGINYVDGHTHARTHIHLRAQFGVYRVTGVGSLMCGTRTWSGNSHRRYIGIVLSAVVIAKTPFDSSITFGTRPSMFAVCPSANRRAAILCLVRRRRINTI
jgi:hypothetical protein